MSIRFSVGVRMQRGRGLGGLYRLVGNKRCKKKNVEAKKYKRSKDIKKMWG